jgi:uncharacterized protein YigA (DUF484 family)
MDLQQLRTELNKYTAAINSGKLTSRQLQMAGIKIKELSNAITELSQKETIKSASLVKRLHKVAVVLDRIEIVDNALAKVEELLNSEEIKLPKKALALLAKLQSNYDLKVADSLIEFLTKNGIPQTHRLLILLKQVKETLSLEQNKQNDKEEDVEFKKTVNETYEFFKKLAPYCGKMEKNLHKLGLHEEASFINGAKTKISEILLIISRL